MKSNIQFHTKISLLIQKKCTKENLKQSHFEIAKVSYTYLFFIQFYIIREFLSIYYLCVLLYVAVIQSSYYQYNDLFLQENLYSILKELYQIYVYISKLHKTSIISFLMANSKMELLFLN